MGIIRGDYLLGLGAGKMLLATLVLLNLGPLACAALPSFLANLEEGLTYHKCDSAMCWWTNFDIDFFTDLRVPNSSLVIADYDWNWWEGKMSSLLEECAPSLPLSQVAYSFSACEDIDNSSIEEACIGVQRDWLDERGEIKTSLMQMYSEMPKAESFINECLALEGDNMSEVEDIFDYYDYSDWYEYDYADYYDYYDNYDGNDLVEEKSGGRQKRSLELGKLKATVKLREKRRGRARKGQGAERDVEEQRGRGRNGKRNGKVAEKQRNGKRKRGGQKRKTRKEKKNGKKIKTEKSKKQKKQKGKARKGKEKTKKGKKKNQSGKQTASKKKRKEAKRALKKIGLKKVPTELVLAQLKCIWLAVDLALEDCGREVLKNSNI